MVATIALALLLSLVQTLGFQHHQRLSPSQLDQIAFRLANDYFSSTSMMMEPPSLGTSLADDKAAILQIAAALDRGQAYNPTSGTYYKERIRKAKDMIEAFLSTNTNVIPMSTEEMNGEWELVMTTYPNGIFRSSPTFLAIQEAYSTYNNGGEADGSEQNQQQRIVPDWFPINVSWTNLTKADLFYELHELQAKVLKTNKIGRVAHYMTNSTLYSEFDTAILNLNAIIPIVGWFKFLPEVAGCLVTASEVVHYSPMSGELQLRVDYTTPRKVKGFWGAGKFDWRFPIGQVWQHLPWNQGRAPFFRLWIRYADDNFRVVQDLSGEFFVYTKPVMPRPLDLAELEEKNNGENDRMR